MIQTLHPRTLVAILSVLCLSLVTPACAKKTVEGTPQGTVAVYATTVVEAVSKLSNAVKQLEAQGTIPTAQAVTVVKVARQIDDEAAKLADYLKAYDAAVKGNPASAGGVLDQVTATLNRISSLATGILIPITSEDVRKQIGDLVGAINQTLITTSMTLAKLQLPR